MLTPAPLEVLLWDAPLKLLRFCFGHAPLEEYLALMWLPLVMSGRKILALAVLCCAVTNGLHFRTLARSDMAFMILLACEKDGFVMCLCLKCTVPDNRLLWVDLM